VISGEVVFRDRIRRFFRVPEWLRPSEWVEKYLRLPAGANESEHGRVKLRGWMREILDCFELRTVWDILFSGPTQEGKTFLLRMALAYKIAGRIGPVMWLDSTENKGRSVVKKQIRPMIMHNPVLRARLPADRHHVTNSEILFAGAAFNVYGANSETQVAGDTVETVLGNEAAKWRTATEEEAAILELVRHRTEKYGDTRKHLFSSTPRTAGNLFWQEVVRGDMRRYFVPCPHCGRMQALRWGDEHSRGGVKWPVNAKRPDGSWDLERVKLETRYECENPECPGAPWDDATRLAAVEDPRGEWRPTKAALPGYRSYLLNGLYGHNASRKVGRLAAKFLSARATGFLLDRQDFWNSDMGEVWEAKIEEVNVRKLADLELDYMRGDVPEGVRLDGLILGVDVQRTRFRWVLRGFTWSGSLYLLDFGWAPTWADLDAIERDYRQRCGGVWRAIVDMNFEDRRQEVREQVYARQARGWVLADGVEYSAERVKVDRENVLLGGKGGGQKAYCVRLVISTYDFKCELEARYAGKLRNWYLFRLGRHGLLDQANDQEIAEYAEYKKEILDESRVPRARKQRGLPGDEFRPRTKQNHAGDCEVYILAFFWALRARRNADQRRRDAARAAGDQARPMAKVEN
jgi:phage terminase large subunit GpA-like protein